MKNRDFSILRDPEYYRPTPRVANLAARGGLREAKRLAVRRRLDPQETTPFYERQEDVSLVERCAEWCRRNEGAIGIVIGAFLTGFAIGVIPRLGAWLVEVMR